MPAHADLLEPVTIRVPGLPRELEGFRILHVSDLHVRRSGRRQEAILNAVRGESYDLMAITGDSMVCGGDEPNAAEFVGQLAQASRARLGVVGVWGNHDTAELRRRLATAGVRWLIDAAWLATDVPLSVLGVHCDYDERRGFSGDLVAALLDEAEKLPDDRPRFRLLLAHMPIWLPAAAGAGIDLMLCGHTHAGQCRLPTGHLLYNATPRWPLALSQGLIRQGQTPCLISRGLGEVYVTGLRLWCKPQMPLVTLTQGEGAERIP